MEKLRYISGFFAFIVILGAFYLQNPIVLFIIALILTISALREYRQMFLQKGIKIHPVLPEAAAIFCAFNFIMKNDPFNQFLITPVIMFTAVFCCILTVILNKKPYIMTSLASFGAFLFTFSGLYTIKMTYFYEKSFYLMFVYFIMVLLGDYTASRLGPKFNLKLSKDISPDKTVGGFICHLVFCIVFGFLLKYLIGWSLVKCIAFSVIVSIFAQMGDLTVSSIKRDLEVKHSSNLFSGFGGILDRLDSFIFSAPAAYYYLCLISVI